MYTVFLMPKLFKFYGFKVIESKYLTRLKKSCTNFEAKLFLMYVLCSIKLNFNLRQNILTSIKILVRHYKLIMLHLFYEQK